MGNTLDIKKILRVIYENLIFIIFAAVACGLIGFVVSYFFIAPQYKSEALFYVESKNNADNTALTYNDINAADKLVAMCREIFTSTSFDETIRDKISSYKDIPVNTLNEMVTIESENTTGCFKAIVTSSDPELSNVIAAAIVDNAPEIYASIVKSGTVKVIDEETYNSNPVSPNILLYTLAGLVIGIAFSAIFVLIIDALDTKVKDEDDLFKIYNIPTFVEVTDFKSLDKPSKAYKSYYSTES